MVCWSYLLLFAVIAIKVDVEPGAVGDKARDQRLYLSLGRAFYVSHGLQSIERRIVNSVQDASG